MNVIRFNRNFRIIALIVVFFFAQYVLMSIRDTIWNDDSEELEKFKVLCEDEKQKEIRKIRKEYEEKISQPRIGIMQEVLDSSNVLGDTFVRDFYRYKCKSMKKYGSSDTDPMYRVDGAYFVCNDGNLKPIHSNCIVLSFGVNTNDNFESEINKNLNCLVHSFDPFIEPPRIAEIRRQTSKEYEVSLKVNDKWFFHSMGITNTERIRDKNKKGWLDTYDHILDYIDLKGKIIDVFKIDTEGAEWESFPDIMSKNPSLLCDYVKQIAIETHSWLYNHTHNYQVIQSLEKCFRLFRRDHRFYISLGLTEWQMSSFSLDLKKFKDEVELAKLLFTYGELYFINVNFL